MNIKSVVILSNALNLILLVILGSLFLKVIDYEYSKNSRRQVLAETTTVLTTEKFIPIGTGSVQSNFWTDVSGLQETGDTNLYKKIQKVTFEVAVVNQNTSGTISVRLYNVTKNYPVWTSVVSKDSNSGYLTSGAVTLDTGTNIYKVQMMNSLNAPSQITQSRLRIVSN